LSALPSIAAEPAVCSFHGLPLDLALPPWERAWRLLFALFPRTSAESPAARLTITRAAERVTVLPDPTRIPRFFFGLMQGYETPDGYVLEDTWSRIDVHCDRREIAAHLFVHDDGSLPVLTGGMQHAALALLLREFGVFDLHAAGVVCNEHALLIVGDAGAGKTTTALSLLASGCHYLGDDRVLLRAVPEGVELLSYPREFHVSAATADAFPTVLAHAGPLEGIGDKRAVDPARLFPQQHRAQWRGPITLLFPQITDAAVTTLRPLPPVEALGHLLGSSALTLVEGVRHGAAHLALLKSVAERARAFDLLLGRDLLASPSATGRAVLDQLGAHPPT
jgi:hypothetical protein